MRNSATGPVTIPAEIWSRSEVITALTRRDIGGLFRLILNLTELSQTRIGTATGFAQGRISDIVHRRTQVRGVVPLTRIADGLDMPAGGRAALGLAPGASITSAGPAHRPAGEAAGQQAFGTEYPATTERAIASATGLWHADENRSHDQATYLGKLPEAVNLARAAHGGLRDLATPALTAQFLAMEARALARMGDARGCHAALAAAERTFQAPEAGHDPDFIGYFNEAEFTAEAAHCFRDLGDARQAASLAARAVPSDGTYARSDFFVTVVRADALADQDEPGQACQVALDALTIGETLTSARCVTYVRDFRKRLRRFEDVPEVRDFTEQAAGHSLWIKAA